MKSRLFTWSVALPLTLISSPSFAASLSLAVQPMLGDDCSMARYERLSEYLGARTGNQVKLVSIADDRAFRSAVKQGDFDFVVTTDRYVTANRFDEQLVPLVVTESARHYQLLTRSDATFTKADDLLGHTVAGESAPSIASTTFVNMYPNPVRQPEYRPAASVSEVINMLNNHSVDAALVPQVAARCARNLKVIADTAVTVRVVVAAARHVEVAVQSDMQAALLGVGKDVEGLRVLDETRLHGFSTIGSQVDAEAPLLYSLR